MIKKLTIFFAAVYILLSSFSAFSQTLTPKYGTISDDVHGYYEYLPENYPEPGVKYPILFYYHGYGDNGDGSPAMLPMVLNMGVGKLINEGNFPKSFTVNGQVFKFIIIIPQFARFPSVNDGNNTLNVMLERYPIDINRVYLTGLSMGGGLAWFYPGYDPYYTNRIAAIVPICGSTDPTQTIANNIANANLPVWATHNNGDPQVSVNVTNTLIDLINNRTYPPIPLAKKTIFISNTHDAYTRTYDPTFKEDGKNIYEWMLQYKRNFVVLAAEGLNFSANLVDNANKVALKWNTTAESNVRGYKVLKSNDGRQFEEIGFVPTGSANGAGAQYSFYDANVNLGKSFYKLLIIEYNRASTFSSIVQITREDVLASTLYPNPAKNMLALQTSGVFKSGEVYIYNSQGQKLIQLTLNGSGRMSIDIRKLKPGNYIARITNGNNTENIKFIKQ